MNHSVACDLNFAAYQTYCNERGDKVPADRGCDCLRDMLADALEAFVAEAHKYGGCFIDQIDAARAALRAAGRLP